MRIKYLPFIVVIAGYLMTGANTSNASTAKSATNSCVTCHRELHEKILFDFKDDVHSRAGLSCQDCHGGDPSIADEEAMNPKSGFIGAPKKKDVPQFCGKCHSDPR